MALEPHLRLPGTGPAASAVPCSHTLFDQPWWLDAVAPGEWGEVLLENAGRVEARLPFVVKRRLGVTALTHPPLTPTLGPWIAPSSAKYAKALSREHQLMEQLIANLPRADIVRQAFHPSVTNWLPFHWAGFDVGIRCTYRLDDLSDLDRVWSGFRENIRKEVHKATRQLEVRDDLGVETLLDLNEKTYARQGLPLPYPRSLVRRVDLACAERDARRTWFAVDADGRIHAAHYFVWDQTSAYSLVSGADPDLRTSGASSLLVWEAIRFSGERGLSLDFEGSIIPSIERFFRAFGARQVPYLYVSRTNARGRAAGVLQDLVRRSPISRGG